MRSIVLAKNDYFALEGLVGGSPPFDLPKGAIESASLARAFGARERNFMRRKEKIKDHNQPQGKLTPIPDFLPPPEQLVPSEETIKITVAVDSKTLKFFKEYAKKSGLKYQRIIREVLKGYARKYG